MADTPEVHDVKGVTCGLVPVMASHLAASDAEEVHFLVRKGIQTELWHSFGTGGKWRLREIREDIFNDVAVFQPHETDELDPLGLMEF